MAISIGAAKGFEANEGLRVCRLAQTAFWRQNGLRRGSWPPKAIGPENLFPALWLWVAKNPLETPKRRPKTRRGAVHESRWEIPREISRGICEGFWHFCKRAPLMHFLHDFSEEENRRNSKTLKNAKVSTLLRRKHYFSL